ncbi:MAG: hypothetical protein JWM16_2933 [Verrucomicrobiales bacterium]|nr:hypothetical protein [Verrucomicrobiales bacterium]
MPVLSGRSPAKALSLPSALGEKRLLLYQVDFSDAPGSAIASNAAVTLAAQLNAYYRDMSYGKMGFAAVGSGSTVTPTLRLPLPSTAYDNNFTKLIDETRAVAAAAGYPHTAYDFDIVFTGAKPFLVFGAVGNVGGPGLWVGNNNFNVPVTGHELGHNLGLPHASSWNTGDLSAIGPGTRGEYGDLFDSMGVPAGSTSHFNTRFKQFLGWLSDEEAPYAVTNGVYRIAAHDSPAAQGVRALRIQKSATLTYWLEYRQFFAGNRWVTNGLGFRWGGPGAENTMLLDTTPGSVSGLQDSALWVGRTFSDLCLDTHITVLGKAGTNPESLDVAVQRGPFPLNVRPIVAVNASTPTTLKGRPVTLTALATDLNGDSLAYFWDFGDGNFGTNQAIVSYAWPNDGEYVVRCTVSDMKGGTASALVVVRVGTFSTFLVQGRILAGGAPVEGAVIKTSGRVTYSDSDGYYVLSRLAAGRFTISAQKDGYSLFNAGFENPITVGPSASNLNFQVLPFDMNSFSLVATGSVWKYLDGGVGPAAGWMAATFNDSSWKTGTARFGYGVGGEATLIDFGPNPASRPITTWFRKSFYVENPALFPHVVCRLRRDDGAVVYLNGQEVVRENLPSGPVSSSTTAIIDVGSSEEPAYFSKWIESPGLVAGTNVIAVELHLFSPSSPDLSFDLELAGLNENLTALRPALTSRAAGTNAVLEWPNAYAGWSLQRAASLEGAAGWSTLPVGSSLTNDLRRVTLPRTNQWLFLRLAKPTYCEPILP